MPEIINSSFIPKKDYQNKEGKKKGFFVNVFLLISVILFFFVGILSIGVFLWEKKVKEDNVVFLSNIEKNKSSFKIDTLRGLIQLDKQIKAAEVVLQKHYSVLPIFDFLERKTLSKVFLDDFSLSEDDDNISFKAKAFADDFDTIAVQSKKYAEEKKTRNLVLSNYDTNTKGASFDLSFFWKKTNLLDI